MEWRVWRGWCLFARHVSGLHRGVHPARTSQAPRVHLPPAGRGAPIVSLSGTQVELAAIVSWLSPPPLPLFTGPHCSFPLPPPKPPASFGSGYNAGDMSPVRHAVITTAPVAGAECQRGEGGGEGGGGLECIPPGNNSRTRPQHKHRYTKHATRTEVY